MTDAPASTRARRSRPPGWLFEGLDLVEQRRRALLLTLAALVVLSAIVAVFAPEVLPPTPAVGAAVGAAALLLGVAVVIALDTADLTVRGPRHVRAAGGEMVAVLRSRPTTHGAAELAGAIDDARTPGRTLLIGIAAAAGDGERSAAWTECLGHRLAEGGTSVLTLDLTGEGRSDPGFLELVRDGHRLASLVQIEPEVRLARLGPGRDTQEALRAFVEASSWIPRDLDVLLVALPMAASRPVVRASLVLDQLLILAERDRTSRVELIAGLDAVEAVGTQAQVILVDDAFAGHLGSVGDDQQEVEAVAPAQPATEPPKDPTSGLGFAFVPEPVPPTPRPGPDPRPGPAPVPGPDPEPVPGPDPEPVPDPDPEPAPHPDPSPEPEPVPAAIEDEPTGVIERPEDEPTAVIERPEDDPLGSPGPAIPEPSAQASLPVRRPGGVPSDPLADEPTVPVRRPPEQARLGLDTAPSDLADTDPADDTGRLPSLSSSDPSDRDDEELLTATALSQLIDEVSDRDELPGEPPDDRT